MNSVFDPLVAKYNKNFRTTKENFATAKEDVKDTLQHAMNESRSPDTFMKYAEMFTMAEKIKDWTRLLQFIYNEELARNGLRTTKYGFK